MDGPPPLIDQTEPCNSPVIVAEVLNEILAGFNSHAILPKGAGTRVQFVGMLMCPWQVISCLPDPRGVL